MRRNYFSGLEIYFRTTKIYFQGFEIYFRGTKKVLFHAEGKFSPRGTKLVGLPCVGFTAAAAGLKLCLEVQDEADATGEVGVDFQAAAHAVVGGTTSSL